MNKPYVVEREYLGMISIRELVGIIIRNHNENNKCKQQDCAKTVENALDV